MPCQIQCFGSETLLRIHQDPNRLHNQGTLIPEALGETTRFRKGNINLLSQASPIKTRVSHTSQNKIPPERLGTLLETYFSLERQGVILEGFRGYIKK